MGSKDGSPNLYFDIFHAAGSTVSGASFLVCRNELGADIGGFSQASATGINVHYLNLVSTSDYRLKHDINPLEGGLSRITALRPCTYRWPDETDGEGFLAHELGEHLPSAAFGAKDAIDESGAPIYQRIDQTKLIPHLVGAIQELAQRLRRVKKPLILVINKIDHDKHNNAPAEFSRLGFPVQIATSAEHNRGMGDLLAAIERGLPPEHESFFPPTANADQKPIKIAIVGRPNVGKSSLTNAILQDDRTLVSPISGTTRDAIDVPYERHGNRYVLIDTAGIRPRGKVDNVVEVFSVMRAEASIRRSDLCLLVIDATMGVTAQDKKIAGIILEAK